MLAHKSDSLTFRLMRCCIALPFAAWMGLAFGLRLPGSRMLAVSLGILLLLISPTLLIRLPRWKGLVAFTVAFFSVFAGYLALRPSNNRDWMPE